jgi:cold shock CspA family protein
MVFYGFGWLQRQNGPDVFFHIRHCLNGYVPKEGDSVSFEIVRDERNPTGRAHNVAPCNADVAADADSERVEWLHEHMQRMMDTTQPLPNAKDKPGGGTDAA